MFAVIPQNYMLYYSTLFTKKQQFFAGFCAFSSLFLRFPEKSVSESRKSAATAPVTEIRKPFITVYNRFNSSSHARSQ